MANRSSFQKIGSRGHKWLSAHVDRHPDWLPRDLGEDFGVDMEFELTTPEILGDVGARCAGVRPDIMHIHAHPVHWRLAQMLFGKAVCAFPLAGRWRQRLAAHFHPGRAHR